jgi:protein transport protein SEC31
LVEFSAPSQWTFDMGWCARNPYLVASSAFSGKLSVFSLFGGQEDIPDETPRVCNEELQKLSTIYLIKQEL